VTINKVPSVEEVGSAAAGRERPPRRIPEVVKRSLTSVSFAVLFLIYAVWLGSKFFNSDLRMLDIHQNAPVLLLALSVMVTLIAGQFDLSVGSMATLTAFLTIGLTSRQGWPFWLDLLFCAGVGLAGGLINGILVIGLRINTFIATLATMGVLVGISSVYADGAAVSVTDPQATHQLPGWFTGPSSFGAFGEKMPSAIVWAALALALAYLAWRVVGRLTEDGWNARSVIRYGAGGLVIAVVAVLVATQAAGTSSWAIGLLVLVALVLWIVVERTAFGRNLRAIGQNPVAARLAGIKTGRETMKAFLIGGFLAALAGVFLAANLGSAQPNVGAGYLLPAFAAAFLSTVLLSSGRFTVWGTIIGGMILVYIGQGLITGGMSFNWNNIVNGIVLAIAVAVSTIFRKN
jgi:ribose/xylose/arabinose/galactoside ABC-type transport system permease subunit